MGSKSSPYHLERETERNTFFGGGAGVLARAAAVRWIKCINIEEGRGRREEGGRGAQVHGHIGTRPEGGRGATVVKLLGICILVCYL